MRIFRFHEYHEIKLILEKANLYNEEHQKVVYNLAKNIEKYLIDHPERALELVFQTNIDRDDATSKRVDIILRERGTEVLMIAIDVCASSIMDESYNRLTTLRLLNTSIAEIFVYDYQLNKWLTNNRVENSYSTVLGVNLSDLRE